MYAILKHGGHQYRVAAGDRLLVDRLAAEVGATVTLEPVLLIGDGDSSEVAGGAVAGASVRATVVAHRRGRKIRVFSYKPKKRSRRTLGFRSQLTELRVDEVTGAGGAKRAAAKPAAAKLAAEKPAAEKPAAEKPAAAKRAAPKRAAATKKTSDGA